MAQPCSMGGVGSREDSAAEGRHRGQCSPRARGDGGKHPGCCSSECSGGSAAAAAAPSGNKRSPGGGGGVSPEQPQVTQGLWLTESLEHMADTLLGTSRLGRRGTLQGIHSFIENTFIYLFIILYLF